MVEEVEEGSRGILSAREMEILLLVAQGLSNRQIANMLRLSKTTVKRHLANAYPKMDVVSRGEAVRKALLEDWITIQDITQEEEQGEDADGRA
jgi:two-component system, NarL family, response regulator LiaR